MTPIEVVLGVLVLATPPPVSPAHLRADRPRRSRAWRWALPQPSRRSARPELVFLFFLPPILYSAGYFTSIRDFKANLRPILLLSIGLVLFTTRRRRGGAQGARPGPAVGRGVRLRRDRVAARRRRRDRDRSPSGVPRRDRDDPRGREPGQRRDRARPAAVRRSSRWGARSASTPGWTFVVVAVGGILIGLVVGGSPAWSMTRIQDSGLGIVFSLLVPAIAFTFRPRRST